MSSISANVTSVNTGSPQRTALQVKPITRIQHQTRLQPELQDTQIIQISHPVNNIKTIVRAQNINEIETQPEIIDRQDSRNITQTSNSYASEYTGGSLNIYIYREAKNNAHYDHRPIVFSLLRQTAQGVKSWAIFLKSF